MSSNNTLDVIQQTVKAYNDRKEALCSELKESFPSMFKPIFDGCPEMDSFTWTQYTPYFNDGDSCEFYVNDCDVINGDYISWVEGTPFSEQRNQVNVILNQVPDDFMEFMFGDHSQITVHRSGLVDVTEADHD